MPVIKIDDLEEGMTLSGDVLNLHGQMIAPKGIKLATKHLRILKAWGITSVPVNEESSHEEKPDDILAHLTPLQFEEIKKKVDEVFTDSNLEDIFIKNIYQISLERKALRLLGKAVHATRA